ncbi:CYTH domain protein [compost metagenome]
MAEEIERKFLVSKPGWHQPDLQGQRIVQGYLSSNAKATVRVRLIDDARAVLTIKGPAQGISRSEFEYAIPLDDARSMLELAKPHIVAKTRYEIPHGGHVWEVDVFEGAHEGLVVAEVELDSEDEAIDPPDWIGIEVSHDDRFANASLSRTPGVPSLDPDAA